MVKLYILSSSNLLCAPNSLSSNLVSKKYSTSLFCINNCSSFFYYSNLNVLVFMIDGCSGYYLDCFASSFPSHVRDKTDKRSTQSICCPKSQQIKSGANLPDFEILGVRFTKFRLTRSHKPYRNNNINYDRTKMLRFICQPLLLKTLMLGLFSKHQSILGYIRTTKKLNDFTTYIPYFFLYIFSKFWNIHIDFIHLFS